MITSNSIKFFESNGYLLFKKLIKKEDIKKCLVSANKLKKKNFMSKEVSKYYEKSTVDENIKILVRIENFYNKDFNLTKLIKNKKIIKILQDLFKQRPVLFKEKINYKLPGCRKDSLHQDSQAGWFKYCNNFISVLISLEKSDLDNGCLQFDISGNNINKLVSQNMKPLKLIDLKKPKFKSFKMLPGDVIFFNSLIPHKSNSNKSKRSRIQVYLTYNKKSDGNFRIQYIKDKEISYPPNNKRLKGINYTYKV
jgi:ectoine hydroxylase-related dioxygenase (phytanoyl-CoA dioxygenase family)